MWYPSTECQSISLPGLGEVEYVPEVRDVERPRIEYDPAGYFRVIRTAPSQPVSDILWTRRRWIDKQLDRVQEELERIDDCPSIYRDMLLLDGRGFQVDHSRGDYYFDVNGDTVYVSVPNEGEHITFLARQIREYLRDRVDTLANELVDELGVPAPVVHVRNQKTKWASCSSKGVLSFNVRSAGLPEAHLEYLVAHELTHLEFSDHGPKFWRTLESVVSNAQRKQRELKGYWHLINQVDMWHGVTQNL